MDWRPALALLLLLCFGCGDDDARLDSSLPDSGLPDSGVLDAAHCNGAPPPGNCQIVLDAPPTPDDCYGGLQFCWCGTGGWTSTHCDPPAPIDGSPADDAEQAVDMGLERHAYHYC